MKKTKTTAGCSRLVRRDKAELIVVEMYQLPSLHAFINRFKPQIYFLSVMFKISLFYLTEQDKGMPYYKPSSMP